VTDPDDVVPTTGWVAPEVAAEFPELRIVQATFDALPQASPPEVKARLRHLSDRFRGAQAVAMRRQPVPHAYRVFFRHVGLDPDEHRTPVEAAAMKRLIEGHFRSDNLLDDALVISLVETGVPIWALDADKVDGELGIRPAGRDERLGRLDEAAPPVVSHRLVVADRSGPLAQLFGVLGEGHGVKRDTRRMTLFAIQVPGVPALFVEEALWCCAELLLDADGPESR
jgi:DNA/RNA-binding domain of Phe-tRNA-synthetase-like protein